MKKDHQLHRLKNQHCQIAVGIMKGESFELRKCVPVLLRGCWLTVTMLMKVTNRTLTCILEMIV